LLTLKKVEFSRLPIAEKVVQLSCGMAHCIAKTSLRKVYVWGDNSRGQLGVGHFKRVLKPKLL
jgi:myosin-5